MTAHHSDDLAFINNDISEFKTGISLAHVDGLQVIGNEIYGLRTTMVSGGNIRNADISDNPRFEGDFAAARSIYRETMEKGKGTSWKSKAEDKLARINNYLKDAKELYQRGVSANKSGQLAEAFEIFIIYESKFCHYSKFSLIKFSFTKYA